MQNQRLTRDLARAHLLSGGQQRLLERLQAHRRRPEADSVVEELLARALRGAEAQRIVYEPQI